MFRMLLPQTAKNRIFRVRQMNVRIYFHAHNWIRVGKTSIGAGFTVYYAGQISSTSLERPLCSRSNILFARIMFVVLVSYMYSWIHKWCTCVTNIFFE
jgi:hypothetical protein